jgi:hypothetical protein
MLGCGAALGAEQQRLECEQFFTNIVDKKTWIY